MFAAACAVGLSLFALEDQIQLTTRPGEPKLFVSYDLSPLDPPERSPSYHWEFPFRVQGFVQIEGSKQLRFRVYAESLDRMPLAQLVCKTLLRLWSIGRLQLDLDHPETSRKIVDLYLASGGRAGGEQITATGYNSDGSSFTKNTIYIYQLNSFTNSIEMLREVAHEYGHALIPPIGGFRSPEEWGNGYLGEKLMLMLLLSSSPPEFDWKSEAMGASPREVQEWLQHFAYPLSNKIWRRGADRNILVAAGPKGLGEYQSLMLYAAEAFPSIMGRALKLARGQRAEDALNGVIAAIGEADKLNVHIPERFEVGPIYLPLRGAWKFVGAKELGRKPDWIQVAPMSRDFTIINLREQEGVSR